MKLYIKVKNNSKVVNGIIGLGGRMVGSVWKVEGVIMFDLCDNSYCISTINGELYFIDKEDVIHFMIEEEI